jgi:hypothetical protein
VDFEISWEDMMGISGSLTCPQTGERVPFNIKTDAKSVARDWNQFIQIRCPHCDERHDFKYKEVYMDKAINGFQDDFAMAMLSKTSPAKKRPRVI